MAELDLEDGVSVFPALTALSPHPAATVSPISGWAGLGVMCLFCLKAVFSTEQRGIQLLCPGKGPIFAIPLPQMPRAHVGSDA